MLGMTIAHRREMKLQKTFKELREPIRVNARAAPEAYANARKAEPVTPQIKEMLNVNMLLYLYIQSLTNTLFLCLLVACRRTPGKVL